MSGSGEEQMDDEAFARMLQESFNKELLDQQSTMTMTNEQQLKADLEYVQTLVSQEKPASNAPTTTSTPNDGKPATEGELSLGEVAKQKLEELDRMMALKMQEQLYQGYEGGHGGGGGFGLANASEFLNKPPPVPVSYYPQESIQPIPLFQRQKHESTDLPPTAEAVKRITSDIKEVFSSKNPYIHVVPDEDDITHVQALIIGPPDTPYSHGFFHFDMIYPHNYPWAPPKVQLITTDSGRCRFNPNLYSNGKVCLSILGTWSGPGWTQIQTMLSTLLSIQSLMNSSPYHNEPGYEKERMLGDVEKYNQVIQHETIRVAVVGMIENPTCGDLFTDVMEEQFLKYYDEYEKVCLENIEKGLDGKKMEDPFGEKRGHFRYAEQLKKLKQLKDQILLKQQQEEQQAMAIANESDNNASTSTSTSTNNSTSTSTTSPATPSSTMDTTSSVTSPSPVKEDVQPMDTTPLNSASSSTSSTSTPSTTNNSTSTSISNTNTNNNNNNNSNTNIPSQDDVSALAKAIAQAITIPVPSSSTSSPSSTSTSSTSSTTNTAGANNNTTNTAGTTEPSINEVELAKQIIKQLEMDAELAKTLIQQEEAVGGSYFVEKKKYSAHHKKSAPTSFAPVKVNLSELRKQAELEQQQQQQGGESQSKDDSESIICLICHQSPKDYIILPNCQTPHTYCMECANKMLKQGSQPVNQYNYRRYPAQNNKRGQGTTITCVLCSSVSSVDPKNGLSSLKRRKKRKTMTGENAANKDKCLEHNEELILYCLDDNELLCALCAGGVHSRHELEALDVAQSKVQVQMQKQLSTLESKREKAQTFIENVKKQSTELRTHSETAQKEAREKFANLRKLLDEKEKEFVESIQRMESTRNGALQVELNKAQQKMDKIDQGVSMLTSAMSESSPLEFLRQIEDADEARYACLGTDPEIKKRWFEMPPIVTQHLEVTLKNLKYRDVKYVQGFPYPQDEYAEESYSEEEEEY